MRKSGWAFSVPKFVAAWASRQSGLSSPIIDLSGVKKKIEPIEGTPSILVTGTASNPLRVQMAERGGFEPPIQLLGRITI